MNIWVLAYDVISEAKILGDNVDMTCVMSDESAPLVRRDKNLNLHEFFDVHR